MSRANRPQVPQQSIVGAMTGLCGKLSLSTNGIDHNAEENCVTKREGKRPIMAQGAQMVIGNLKC